MAWEAWVRMIHVLAAAIWLGGGLFAIAMVLPTVKAAGPAGKAFMMANLKRGGWGFFFGPAGGVTILAGLTLYAGLGYHKDPFGTTASILVTTGALLALAAFVEAMAVSMRAEKKMKTIVAAIGPSGPTPEQGAEMEKLALRLAKAGMRTVTLLLLTMLLMLGRGLVS